MKQVGVRELKDRLSEYLRLVRAGEHVQVTDRGRVIAELIPPPAGPARDVAAGLAELERRGLLRPATSAGRFRYRPRRQLVPDGTAQRILDEERGER